MRDSLLPIGKGRPGKAIVPVGVVVHSTATANASARAIYRWFRRPDSPSASYHVVCDWDESLVLVPCYPGVCEMAYHAGPKANSKYIGIAACESTDPAKNARTYVRLVKVIRGILWMWEIPINSPSALVSHNWVSKNLGGTDHEDPIPWLRSMGKTWNDLVNDVWGVRI